MSAIHSHNVHPALQEIADYCRIGGGFAWHGDHDADFAIVRRLAERFVRVSFQQISTPVEIVESLFERAPGPLFSGEAVEHVQNCVKGREGVRFQSAERTKAEPAKIVLKITQIVPAQTQVVDKISRAFEVTQMDVIQLAGKMLLCLQHIETDGQKSSDEGSISSAMLLLIGKNRGCRKLPSAIKSRDVGDVTIS